jgi:phosphatidylinositol-3-phosphatase
MDIRRPGRGPVTAALAACALLAGCASAVAQPATTGADTHRGGGGAVAPAAAGVPQLDHVVVAVMENHAFTSIIGSASAPYVNSLAAEGALFTQSFGVTHPSQPNYLALFSGSTQGVTDDSCPHTFTAPNLGQELLAAGRTFAGYSEDLPSVGYTGCTSGGYARKHNPWVDFTNVPSSANLRLADLPTDFTTLPTVSFVIPNLCDDMHDCPVSTGDTWLRTHLDAYVQWAATHNSLLVLTFDEDDSLHRNRIATVFVGAQVRPGSYSETIDHYAVLRTIEDMYGLPHAGASATATPITDVWTAAAAGN